MEAEKAYMHTIRSLKDQEQALLAQLTTVRTAISAITALLPKRPTAEAAIGRAAAGVKVGSLAHAVYLVLLEEARPMRVMEVAERLQAKGYNAEQDTRALRQTIAGMISRKKREGDETFESLGDGTVTIRGVAVAVPGAGSGSDDDDKEPPPDVPPGDDLMSETASAESWG